MKVVVIGASGTIGGAVAEALAVRGHEVVRAARGGPIRVDLTDPASLDALFDQVGEVESVVCCAASGTLTRLDAEVSDTEFTTGLDGKLLGQLALARRAVRRLRDGGSTTLTSGVFERPTPGGSFGALVNAGLDAFVRAGAAELPRGLRLNAVSPGWVSETLRRLDLDPAEHGTGTPVAEVSRVYVELVEGDAQGTVVRPGRVGPAEGD